MSVARWRRPRSPGRGRAGRRWWSPQRHVRLSGNGGRTTHVPSVPFSSGTDLWDHGCPGVRALTRGNPGGAARRGVEWRRRGGPGGRCVPPGAGSAATPEPCRPRGPPPPPPSAAAAAAAPVARRPPEEGKLGPGEEGRPRARLGGCWGK